MFFRENFAEGLSRSGVGRKRKPSDLSDSVALPIRLTTPFFDLHKIVRLLPRWVRQLGNSVSG